MTAMNNLLERVNMLTDDQLRMVAERDDASGVLAEYRLAELRGLPAPERTAVIHGDGFVIVAMDGKVEQYSSDEVLKIILEDDGQYCVYSEDGTRSFGCYDSMEEAQERLRQIDYFSDKQAIREGSFVRWNSSGGAAQGQVEHVMREGVLGIPDSEFQINAEPDDPAVLIRIWHNTSEGWQPTETLVGHKMSTLSHIEPLKKETFKPPKGVQEAGKRALAWIAEGHAGGGFTDVGRARASQLARGDNVSENVVRRMRSYLARHESDSTAQGWNFGEQGFPSPGRVAWDAWGGDAGKTWADSIVERLDREEKQACPVATGNVAVNLRNRQTAIEIADYGPLNPALPNNEYWEHLAEYFETTAEEARSTVCGNCAAFDVTSHMQDCIAEGITEDSSEADPYDVVDAGDLGYCRIFKFKCASARTCSAWIAGGPITDDNNDSNDTAKALSLDGRFMRKDAYQKFTLGPLYVPEFMDAHGEWTDANELQQAVWGWVKAGDRTIYLQHDREERAGEWVEVMTMPQPWTVEMLDSKGNSVGEVTYPAGTVFLGVQWDDHAWKDVLAGKLRGYSIGGFSDRVLADLPDDGVRDGIDLPSD
jgi:hypothetical protein